jgi:hypothetical protein
MALLVPLDQAEQQDHKVSQVQQVLRAELVLQVIKEMTVLQVLLALAQQAHRDQQVPKVLQAQLGLKVLLAQLEVVQQEPLVLDQQVLQVLQVSREQLDQ